MLDELDLQLAGRIPRELHVPRRDAIVPIVKHHDPAEPRNHLLQKLEALGREIRKPPVDARESPARLPEALDEAKRDWIRPGVEHDGNRLRRLLGRKRHGAADCVDQVDFLTFEIPRRLLHRLQIALAFADVKDELPLLEAQLPETLPEPVDGSHIRTALQDDSDAIDASLLRFGGAWSGEKTDRHSAEERSSSDHRISVGPASSSASG